MNRRDLEFLKLLAKEPGPTPDVVFWTTGITNVLPIPDHHIDWSDVELPDNLWTYFSSSELDPLYTDLLTYAATTGTGQAHLTGVMVKGRTLTMAVRSAQPNGEIDVYRIGYHVDTSAISFPDGDYDGKSDIGWARTMVRSAEAMVWATIHADQFPILCDTPHHNRNQQKSLTKAGVKISDVKEVRLRPTIHTHSRSKPSGEAREYSHRWEVRGHWRNQSYGPRHSLRRSVWVEPYVKGPKDKPLHRKMSVKVF